MSTSTEKWRETIDPFALPLSAYKIEKVMDYPHAGNDVFHVSGIYDGRPCAAYIKAERQTGADIRNEISILRALPYDLKPRLLDWSLDTPVCAVTEERAGQRLSVILQDAPSGGSRRYMRPYGAEIAKIHCFDMPCQSVKHRRFFDLPEAEYMNKYGLDEFAAFLQSRPPADESRCFVHGDFHYANILWQDGAITAVLDWELSGMGVREFDMAWAVLLRPGQTFLKTPEEIELFLEGYRTRQDFSLRAFVYYYVLAGAHFYALGDEDYRRELGTLMRTVTERYL